MAKMKQAELTEAPIDDVEAEVLRMQAEREAEKGLEADLDAADASETVEQPIPGAVYKPLEEEELSAEEIERRRLRQEAFDRALAFEEREKKAKLQKMAKMAGQPDPTMAQPVEVERLAKGVPDVFYQYALALPPTTPDEHVLCGFGSIKLKVGDFRQLIGLPNRLYPREG